jgi:hypothetical protein
MPHHDRPDHTSGALRRFEPIGASAQKGPEQTQDVRTWRCHFHDRSKLPASVPFSISARPTVQ